MAKEKEEVKKELEMVAAPKQFIIDEINSLIKANKEVFSKYEVLMKALNTPVQFMDLNEGNGKEKDKQEGAGTD